MRRLVLAALALALPGCKGSKPACAQLRAAMCVRNIDSPMVPVLCSAGKAMVREASNEECAGALVTLDLWALSDAPRMNAGSVSTAPSAAPDGGTD